MGRNKKELDPAEELEQVKKELLAKAKEKGVSEHYFFKTTFERYEMQLNILKRLKQAVDSEEVLIEKQYVKDRTNICINPAISEYNKTASAANGTVATLVKILVNLGTAKDGDQPTELMQFLDM